MLLRDEGVVGRLVHQRIELFRVGQLDLDEPAFAHRIGIDLGRVADDRIVDRDDLARHRGIDLARRFDRLDDRRLAALRELAADRRQLDVDDVADAMGEGWFFKVKLSNPKELDALMDEAAYKIFIEGLS